MVYAPPAYSALCKIYNQTVDWKSDEQPENLFVAKNGDGSLTFERRGFGISIWFRRKVSPWISRNIFRKQDADAYSFVKNLNTFRNLILTSVSEVQIWPFGTEGAKTIEKMITVYNALLESTSRERQGTRLHRYVAARSWNILLPQPISVDQILEVAAKALPEGELLMNTVQMCFSRLFQEPSSQEEKKPDPRFSLAVKLVVAGTAERSRVFQSRKALEVRIQSIVQVNPSQEILEGECFKRALSVAIGREVSIHRSETVSASAMVSFLERVTESLDGVERQVSAQKRGELQRIFWDLDRLCGEAAVWNQKAANVHFGQTLNMPPLALDRKIPPTIQDMDEKVTALKEVQWQLIQLVGTWKNCLLSFIAVQSDLKKRIAELENYKQRGSAAGLVATQWINKLQEQQNLLTAWGYVAQEGVQETLNQLSDDAFREALKKELIQQQRGIEEAVRPKPTPKKSIVDSLTGLASKGLQSIGSMIVGKDIEKEIETLANEWHQQAKLYAYTERAIARYEWLQRLTKLKKIEHFHHVDTQSVTSLIQKWHSNPVLVDTGDIAALFGSLCTLEKANIAMQVQLETLPQHDVLLQCALDVLHGFDGLAQIQEKINVLAPVFAESDVWGDQTEHLRARYSASANFFNGCVKEMEKRCTGGLAGSREQIARMIQDFGELVEVKRVHEQYQGFLGEYFSSVPQLLEETGVWNFWIKAKTGREEVTVALQDQFLALDAKKRSLFIARAIVAGHV